MDYWIVFGVLASLIVVKVIVRRLFWRRFHAGGRARWLGRRIGATPEQQAVLEDELDTLREAMWGARGEWRATRDDAAAVLGADTFDKARVEAAFRRQDDVLGGLRRQMLESVERIHASLGPTQRQKLARLLTIRGCHRRHA